MSPDPDPDEPRPDGGSAEQLAPPREETESDSADIRGEHREDTTAAWLTGYTTGTRARITAASTTGVSVHDPPANITSNWRDYYKGFPLTRTALRKFDEDVIEPGYTLRAVDPESDEQDDDMTEALQMWAEQCVIHAGETGQDLSVLLGKCPSRRRGRGTTYVEVAGTKDDPDAIAGLIMHDPSTFRIYTRENQTVLIQPDDDVPADHPTTPDGKAAAYVQYDNDLPDAARFDDKDEIAFAADEIVKLVYDADEGALWGTSVFESIGDRIDSLIQKLSDRDTAIKTAGHPWRVISSDRWTEEEAEEYARKHERGTYSAYERGVERDPESFAGRTDFVPHDVINIETHSGSVADIDDAVLDDVRLILSALPVSRFRVAYEESINQFVVEPQADDDAQTVDRERRYLERKFGPLIEAKADELAGGEYDGEIEFGIRQPAEDNPLERESFDPERFKAVLDALANYTRAGAEVAFPREFVMFLLGTDMEEFDEMFGSKMELDEQRLLEGADLPEADEAAVQAALDDEQTQDIPTPPDLPDEGGE